eukprot:TRINITY_DN606_c0_g1::TRINITY_DN606_c0_g1_i1::g.28930::m.28930 TRINITY_DN606_c0_g1::TRINITY_DN606_c0_g1_i1::g.28930  ORF type:complete len:107 (+),score=-11.10,CDC48_2/PF02933.12/0.26 TRINITY_DN606_c0_g1_i1:325-645(+)
MAEVIQRLLSRILTKGQRTESWRKRQLHRTIAHQDLHSCFIVLPPEEPSHERMLRTKPNEGTYYFLEALGADDALARSAARSARSSRSASIMAWRMRFASSKPSGP